MAYGTGATMQRLVTGLVNQSGITSVHGSIVGDESYFDSLRGTPATGFAPSTEVEGELSGLAYDRGFSSLSGSVLQNRPALVAAQQFELALRAAGVKVPSATSVLTGATPAAAQPLAAVASPPMATLIALTNTPSDNFFAEMLLKGIGARFGGPRLDRGRRCSRPRPARPELRDPSAAERRLRPVALRSHLAPRRDRGAASGWRPIGTSSTRCRSPARPARSLRACAGPRRRAAAAARPARSTMSPT